MVQILPKGQSIKRVFFLLLVLVSIFSICDMSTAGTRSDSLRVFLSAFRQIQRRYVEEQSHTSLIRGALEGISRNRPEVADAIESLKPSSDGGEDRRRDFDALDRAIRIVRQNEKEAFDAENCYRDAIEGMVAGLIINGTRDHYSSYMRPESLTTFRESLSGSFAGVGIVIEYKEGRLLVIRPIEGSPAYDAGMKAGDSIVQVDGVPLGDVPIVNVDQAAKVIRGPVGSEIVLGVERDGVPEVINFRLKRAQVRNVTNVQRDMLTDQVGYISIRGFTEAVVRDVAQAVRYLETAGMESLILDLRSNPGGLLDMAAAVADLFLETGFRITYTQGREPRDFREYLSQSSPLFDGPIVILVNEFSASASEIVAGALKDNGRAELLGMRTFGKGSVQEIIELSDHSALRLTVALYYTPSGICIQGSGIEPGLVVAYELEPAQGPRDAIASESVGDATDEVENTPIRSLPRYMRDSQTRAAVEFLESRRTLVSTTP